jgi:two-component system, NarL family, nitrate/nitrite response regulator NarL
MLENMEIAVAGAHGLLRAGIACLLKGAAKRVHEAANIEALENLLGKSNTIGLVLIDLAALNGTPVSHIGRIRALRPGCRIAILSDAMDSAQMTACFAAGADGFLLKDISADTLTGSLRLIALGEKVFPSSLAEFFAGEAPAESQNDLSQREMDILRCLVEGDSNKRIANRLNITEATVKVHLKSILRKTHTSNRTQAAIWSLQHGIRKPRDAESREGDVFESKLPASRC